MNIIEELENNNKILGFKPKLISSNINFNGKNNILVCEEDITLYNSQITFHGDNSIVYLSKNKFNYMLNISILFNSVCFIGENNYFNGKLNIQLSEHKHVFIGNGCLFSFGIWMRVSDVHLLYDVETLERINYSKSIFIGDHVWVGQDVMILKGTKIGSGSVIGARSLVSNKLINSNTVWAGVPAREVKNGVFFDGNSTHKFTKEDTEKRSKYQNTEWIYELDEETIPFSEIDEQFDNIENVNEKLEYVLKIRNNTNHNRFYVNDKLEEEFVNLIMDLL